MALRGGLVAQGPVGLGMVALTICMMPVASGFCFGAAPASQAPIHASQAPIHQVNRSLKGDRLVEPVSVVTKRKVPVQVIRELPPAPEAAKRMPMDGCEPLFSPVTMPSAAHLTGRCVG